MLKKLLILIYQSLKNFMNLMINFRGFYAVPVKIRKKMQKTNMCIKTFTIMLLVLLFAFNLFAEENKTLTAKIDYIIGKGNVKIIKPAGKKLNAKNNMTIYSGDKIKTDEKTTVQISLDNNTKVRIAKNTEFELKGKAGKKETIFSLTIGKIWASFKKLKKDHKYSVETPTAVAGVRGTIFVVQHNENNTTLFVGEGKVNFLSKLLKKEINVEHGFMITMDNQGNLADARKMSSADKKQMMSGIPVFFKQKKAKSKDVLKSEILNEKKNLNKQNQFASKLKSEDLTAGRTLKDIHGNIVRVEQLFRKQGSKSFQVINLTMRDDGLAYFDLTLTYNKELPKNYKNWGAFFMDDAVNLDKKDFKLGTKRAGNNNDEFHWTGTYNPVTEKWDEVINITGKDGNKTGLLVEAGTDGLEEMDYQSGSDGLSSTGTLTLDDGGPNLTFKFSIYIINNDGDILSEKYFKSGNDIINIFNTTAAEIIIHSNDDFFYGDIDVVTVPNIAFVIIQEVL